MIDCLLLTASLCATVNAAPAARFAAPVSPPAQIVQAAHGGIRESAQPRVAVLRGRSWRRDSAFVGLSTAAYLVALMDIIHTERLGKPGIDYRERDPLSRPFVGNAPLHVATGMAAVTAANWLSWKMRGSRRWRRVWWLPQAAAMGLNAWGYAVSSKPR
jgi:hypothetical protein